MSVEQRTAKWFKSSRSVGDSDCVEVAHLERDRVGVRDSKNPSGPALVFAPSAWDSFITQARSGVFDHG
ncbi:DUF397 domain-containing protein [Nocardia cyriacigeorgica]|uniref:DUF397 domain-containing protein n=1 Tax=Nocardia cyriacigeorgica TaxID=135487 RepID=UPI000661FD3F|nr:DUF397 domain-containing protein [Nocardia cyriacigeorgica]MBF6289783.1 DUF397 domain-containing protein [Nocardia cyriacigeorgica]